MNSSTYRKAVLAIVVFAAIGLGAFYLGLMVQNKMAAPQINGVLLVPPKQLPSFELVDESEQGFNPEDFRGAWSFLYFGYSYCPDVCPMSLAQMALLKKRLEESGFDESHRYYLVSVDPERDTALRLREYVTYFDPEFKGLSGDPAQIDIFAKAAGIAYQLPADRSDPDYLVAHSSVIVLINPEGELYAYFTSPLDGDVIAGDFLNIVD